MQLIYTGKTKDLFALDNGNYLLKFKDDVTGSDGVFDPGANTVGLSIEGAGMACLLLTEYFYEKLNSMGIPTHFVRANRNEGTMEVKKASVFGEGLEFICRYRAVGSFLRRYGKYAKDGQSLDALVEVTLKDDERNDPPITEDALAELGLLTRDEYRNLVELTKNVGAFVKKELAARGMELYDIKFEFGRTGEKQEIVLIDEISGGNMRAYKDGQRVEPLELRHLILG